MADSRARAFVDVLLPAFEQAVAIATALEGRVTNKPKQDEASAVKAALTVADTASQEALLIPLLDAFRGSRLEAEEDTPSVALFQGRDPADRIVIDPIDGTYRYYLGRGGPYAILAGWARNNVYESALVALPRENLILAGAPPSRAASLLARPLRGINGAAERR